MERGKDGGKIEHWANKSLPLCKNENRKGMGHPRKFLRALKGDLCAQIGAERADKTQENIPSVPEFRPRVPSPSSVPEFRPRVPEFVRLSPSSSPSSNIARQEYLPIAPNTASRPLISLISTWVFFAYV